MTEPRVKLDSVRRLLLPGLIFILLAWDLWAVLLDQRPSSTDTITIPALQLHRWLSDRSGLGWHETLGPNGPVAPLLGLLLLLVVGKAPLALRLLSVMAHGVMTWQTYSLGRALGGRRAGLWAALLFSTQPMVFGWCRLDYRDPLLVLFFLAALQMMLRVRLDRWTPALLLGILIGFGLMIKVTLAVFLAVPGVWFIARRVRCPAHLLRLGGLAAAVLLVVAPWVVPIMAELLVTLPGVTAGMAGGGQWARLLHYMNLPGTLPFFGAALAISPALFFSRRLNRARLVLLLGTFLFCLASFLLVFHSWSRYIMPLFPLAALLLGIAADRIQLSLGPRLGPLLAMAAAAVLLALMSGISVTGLETEQDREQYLGMITPDRRAYRGYPRAISKLLPFGPDVVMVRDSFKTLIRTHAVEDLWYFSGHKAVSMEQEELKAKSRLGETLSVLLIRLDPKAELTTQSVDRAWPTPDPNHHDISYPARWFLAYPEREHLLTAFDASGVAYSAFRVKTYANQPIP